MPPANTPVVWRPLPHMSGAREQLQPLPVPSSLRHWRAKFLSQWIYSCLIMQGILKCKIVNAYCYRLMTNRRWSLNLNLMHESLGYCVWCRLRLVCTGLPSRAVCIAHCTHHKHLFDADVSSTANGKRNHQLSVFSEVTTVNHSTPVW